MTKLHFFSFGVEPLPTHPNFWQVQAGFAHILLRRDSEDTEAEARAMIEACQWKIQNLHTSCVTDESRLDLLPPEAQLALRVRDHYLEFVAYETGGGSEEPENPFL